MISGKRLALLAAVALVVGGCGSQRAQHARAGELSAHTTGPKTLGRAELWNAHCTRCHSLRPATEFNQTQWSVIVNHMRTVADLPGEDYRRLLEYLAGTAPAQRTTKPPAPAP